LFAERYGYTLHDFYSLTLRQIFNIKKALEKSKTKRFEWEAALAGKPIEKKSTEGLDLTKEEHEKNDTKAQELLERMRKEYGQRSRVADKNKRDSEKLY